MDLILVTYFKRHNFLNYTKDKRTDMGLPVSGVDTVPPLISSQVNEVVIIEKGKTTTVGYGFGSGDPCESTPQGPRTR